MGADSVRHGNCTSSAEQDSLCSLKFSYFMIAAENFLLFMPASVNQQNMYTLHAQKFAMEYHVRLSNLNAFMTSLNQ